MPFRLSSSPALTQEVGPLLGGLFANPAVHLNFPGPRMVFEAYPWLLSCLISAAFNITVSVASYVFLYETLHEGSAQITTKKQRSRSIEEDPLLESPYPQEHIQGGSTYGAVHACHSIPTVQTRAQYFSRERLSQATILLSAAYVLFCRQLNMSG